MAKYTIGTLIKTINGEIAEIKEIIIGKDYVNYNTGGEHLVSEQEVIAAYAPVLAKPEIKRRTRRKKAVMPDVKPVQTPDESIPF